MKRFIRYLYEYEQNKQVRNVGFVKVELKEDSCVVNIHGKGLRLEGSREVDLYVFYNQGEECICHFQGGIDQINPTINYRLEYQTEDIGGQGSFDKVNGIILVNPGGKKYAAVWDDAAVNVDNMVIARAHSEPVDSEPAESVHEESREIEEPQEEDGEVLAASDDEVDGEPAQDSEEMKETEDEMEEESAYMAQITDEDEYELSDYPNVPGVRSRARVIRPGRAYPGTMPQWTPRPAQPLEEDTSETNPETGPDEMPEPARRVMPESEPDPATTRPQQPMPESANELQTAPTSMPEQPDEPDVEAESYVMPHNMQCEKIKREDLVRLPKKEWRVANNSFLLHGYYNYHHILLIEENGRLFLGVPGVYHDQESRAASSFGFPQFIRISDVNIQLDENEQNTYDDFGYWCREVSRRQLHDQ